MRFLAEDIKNQNFKKVYLLCGDEAYLRGQYKQKLKEAVVSPDDTMNQSVFEGKDINPIEIIDLAETMPFFSERRLISVEDSGFFKNKCEELADYIPRMPESTCLVFTESEVDKRGRLYKVVKEQGRIVEFVTQDERTLMRWILGKLKSEQKNITEETLHLFMERVGMDMSNISNELEKLLSYCMDKNVITNEDVLEITTGQTEDKVFDMLDAISEHRQKRALQLYKDLIALKTPPLKILSLLVGQFNKLLIVRNLLGLGFDGNTIASKAGISPYFVNKKYIPQAKKFSQDTLENAVRDCVQADEDIKTGKTTDELAVEMILIKYSKTKN